MLWCCFIYNHMFPSLTLLFNLISILSFFFFFNNWTQVPCITQEQGCKVKLGYIVPLETEDERFLWISRDQRMNNIGGDSEWAHGLGGICCQPTRQRQSWCSSEDSAWVADRLIVLGNQYPASTSKAPSCWRQVVTRWLTVLGALRSITAVTKPF